MKTIIEPFKVKVVEPIKMTTRDEREHYLKDAAYNLFLLKAENVIIDLLTDSGTAAMSADQWSALMRGDESYAGSRSFYRFEEVVRDIFGFKQVIPMHQGRAAERILFSVMCKKGSIIPIRVHACSFEKLRGRISIPSFCGTGIMRRLPQHEEMMTTTGARAACSIAKSTPPPRTLAPSIAGRARRTR